ncbi:MAG TPA: baseplate J/gp47 family protein [Ktedonosporobacter sp.]|jgi:hypothetical protein|nr:baseplate J/gp47 family protein [Ktedonosporobacter sp.]
MSRIQEDAEHILAQLSSLDATHSTQEQEPHGPIRLIDIHIYEPEPEEMPPTDAPSVEGTLVEEERVRQPPQAEEPHEDAPNPMRRPPARRKRAVLPVLLVLVCLLAGSSLLVLVALPLLTPSATVTIVPRSTVVSVTRTLVVATDQTQPLTAGQLPGRSLASLSMSQALTVPTTGTVHQEAQMAHGLITFYNAAPIVQVVSAGTLIVSPDGRQVVTDADAVIPAAVYPTFGQVTVSAHATQPGPAGNLAAGAIYGPCCRLNVSAVNSAFYGGQLARTYPVATQHDIDQAAARLTTDLDQSIQAALQTQVQSEETLLVPQQCSRTVTADHPAGTEATQTRVTVIEQCRGIAVPTSLYEQALMQAVAQEAAAQLGTGYSLQGTVQARVMQVRTNVQGNIDVQVQARGMLVAQVSQEQQQHLKAMIAGKSKAQAIALLLGTAGIKTVSVTLSNNGTMLPTDVSQIHLAFLIMQE